MVYTTAARPSPMPSQQFSPLENGGFQNATLMGAALTLDGFTHQNPFIRVVGDYLRTSQHIVLWNMLRKEPAEADQVSEILESQHPDSGFFDKLASNPNENATDAQEQDLSDPGQTVKACGGLIQFGHYAQSLALQQGMPFGNQVATKTERLISSTCIAMEKALFIGDASTNPLSFNGFTKQMPVGNQRAASLINGDVIWQKLSGLVRLARNNEFNLQIPTHIFTSGLGVNLVQNEVDQKLEFSNLSEAVPGVRVPRIQTDAGQLPLVSSPFLQDYIDPNTSEEFVDYWVVDLQQICWKGVFPKGGIQAYEPQIFDVMTNSAPYLTEKRLCLAYGTLYAKNRGRGIWRLRVRVPNGTIGQI
jgi:hypothetical protein